MLELYGFVGTLTTQCSSMSLQQSMQHWMLRSYDIKQKGLLMPTAQRCTCEMWNAHPSCWDRFLWAQILREGGHSLPKCWYHSI